MKLEISLAQYNGTGSSASIEGDEAGQGRKQMTLYRLVKIGPSPGGPLENLRTGEKAFVPVGAQPEGRDGFVRVYPAGVAVGVKPERLEETDE